MLGGFFDQWRRGAPAPAVALVVDYWNGAGSWVAMAEPHRERIRAGAERFREEVVCAYDDTTSAEEVRAITLPTLIVHGAKTTDESRVVCRILTRSIPGARSLSVAGAGHSPMRSHPDRFATALLDLITSTRQAS